MLISLRAKPKRVTKFNRFVSFFLYRIKNPFLVSVMIGQLL